MVSVYHPILVPLQNTWNAELTATQWTILPKSIGPAHISSFQTFLNTPEEVTYSKEILKYVISHWEKYFTDKAIEWMGINITDEHRDHPQVQKWIADLTSKLEEHAPPISNRRNRKTMPALSSPPAVPVYAGGAGIVSSITAGVAGVMYLLYWYSKGCKLYRPHEFEFKNVDTRRSVLGVSVPEIGFKCVIKCSTNEDYIDGYVTESNVYKVFEEYRKQGRYVPVLRWYGEGWGDGDQFNHPIDIKDGHRIQLQFSIPLRTNESSLNQHFFLANEWGQSTFDGEEFINHGDPNATVRNATNAITRTMAQVYLDYGFYHGDFKMDNVFCYFDGYTRQWVVKLVDFDFSGFTNRPLNMDKLTLILDTDENTVSNMYKKREHYGFPLFFDLYRFWCSMFLFRGDYTSLRMTLISKDHDWFSAFYKYHHQRFDLQPVMKKRTRNRDDNWNDTLMPFAYVREIFWGTEPLPNTQQEITKAIQELGHVEKGSPSDRRLRPRR